MKRGLLIAGRLILAGIFIYAAYAKLRDPWLQFAISIDSFKIVPENYLEIMARALPWCELALGIALLSGIFVQWFGLIAALLLGTFLGAAVRAYSMGLQPDCGCFGAGGGDMLGPKWFAEHGAMVLLALAVSFGGFVASRRTAKMTPATAPANVRLPDPDPA
jgi:uncharacterized membrane protein YphA (DoxX/SURF4 family)